MKNVITLILGALLIGTACITEVAVAQENEPFRAMSFNIRFDNPDDGPDAWPHRKDMVASVVRLHQADIVGTQEALHHQLDDMQQRLPDFDWVGVGRDDGGTAGEFSAIFFRTSRFDLLDEDTFWLSESPHEPGSVGWDASLPRIVSWARLRDQTNDQVFVVFNTHFDHRGEEARLESARLIVQKVEEIAAGEPVIVMGDLNATEDEAPYRVFSQVEPESDQRQLQDGFYASQHPHHGPTTTWTGFEEIIPDRRIDYIFVDDHFAVLQHAILADVWDDGHFPSDHLPVLAELVMRSE